MHVDFTLTLSALGTIASILTVGWGIISRLRRISELIGTVHVQHRIMWSWFSQEHADHIPAEFREDGEES